MWSTAVTGLLGGLLLIIAMGAQNAFVLRQGLRREHIGSVVATTLALTYLNPHVYLDTVLMLGHLANHHGSFGRWLFAGGAAVGSLIWFTTLGFAARALAGPLARPTLRRVIDSGIG